MQRHDVGLSQQILECDQLAAGSTHGVGGNEGVMHEPPTLERSPPRRDLSSDATEANQADRLIAHRPQLIERRRQSPFAVSHMQRVGHDLPRDSQDERERVIGDFINAVIGDVADGDAPLARRLHVNVVVADAIPHDDLGSLHRTDHFRVDRGELRDDRVSLGNQCLERGNLLVVPAAQLEPAGGQDRLLDVQIGERVIGDRNRGHGVLAFVGSGVCSRVAE